VPVILLTLGIADCVHVLVNFLHRLRAGLGRRDAMLASLRINLQPIFLTSVTTAIGFLSLNFSEVPPFRDLGNMAAIGVGLAFLLSVSFLPALMMYLPLGTPREDSPGNQAMPRFAEWVIGRHRILLWGVGGLALLLIAQIPRNELNDEFVKYFDQSFEFRRDTDFTTEHLTGIYRVEYSFPSGEPGGINEPAYLQRLEAFADWYRAQPEGLHVSALTDIVKRLNRNLHGDDPVWYRLPETRELAAQYLLLYQLSLPFGLALTDQIDVDRSATRVSVILRNLTTNQMLDLEARAQDWLRAHLPAGLSVEGSSAAVIFSHIGARNIRAMLKGAFFAMLLISAVLVVALRSVRIGLLSMLPNLVPLAMAFGLWGLLVGQVGLALSVVTGMTLGIVVDDTVHFLSKYLRARREEGKAVADAVRQAFATVGTALWVTSLVLVLGFLVLALSNFELNAGMGLLAALTIALALGADFLLLPALLLRFGGKHEDNSGPAA
jgi:predicted RND superfamily exporter protein